MTKPSLERIKEDPRLWKALCDRARRAKITRHAALEKWGHPEDWASSRESSITKPVGLAEHLSEIWDETVGSVQASIGSAGLESLCIQIHRMRDAQARVTDEGMVTSDAKGNPCPHPALEIERKAQAEVRTWLKMHGVHQ